MLDRLLRLLRGSSSDDATPGQLEDALAIVDSPNDVVSPFSGLRAAAFQLRFVARVLVENRYQEGSTERIVTLREEALGGDLLLTLSPGVQLRVPAADRQLSFPGIEAPGLIIERMPPGWERVLAHPLARRSPVSVVELPLVRGDEVRVTARVERDTDVGDGAGSYREAGGGSANLVARADLGPVRIEQRLPSF